MKLEDIEYKFSKNYSMTSSHLKSDDYNEVTTTDGKTLYVKCGDGFNGVYDPAKLEHQSFKWTPEGIDLSNSTIEQIQGYLDREYSSYISDLKERPAHLTDEASWLEKEFALTKNTWGLVIEKAKNGIYESWIDEAKEDNFEFGLNAGLYLKFGVKKRRIPNYIKSLRKAVKSQVSMTRVRINTRITKIGLINMLHALVLLKVPLLERKSKLYNL